MNDGRALQVSNVILSGMAGLASFVFSLAVFIHIKELDGQILASIVAGLFCLMICYAASERPDASSAKAMASLAQRLLAVEDGDLTSPPPDALRRSNPKLAAAVDTLFEEVRASIENAHALGMYDPVTSLPNRLHFRSEADKLLGAPDAGLAAMMFIDLDRFKAVNDCLGHARGDQLLVMVANRLRVVVTAEMGERNMARPLLARLAGDEFTLFFPELESVADIEMVARRIALAISDPFELNGHNIDIGASVGVALAPAHGDTVEQLMRAADLAMYQAKARGGGQYCLFTADLAAEHQRRKDVEQALTDIVARGQLRLALQPQMSLVTGEVSGVEALLRWQHPIDGVRLPGTFIPIAEQSGAMAEIGDWVLTHCASILAGWMRQGVNRRLSINVSPRQIDRVDFFTRLRHIFAEHDVPLSMIELEFSEGAVMECSEAELAEIAALRSEGASIALDDFGTGFSNIARLRTMPVDRVKLDQTLIADIETSEQARIVVQALVHLIKGVGCAIVAESVENAAQADLLRAMGCDSVQGYVFAGPMSEDEFAHWSAHNDREARSAA
ncbi:putative bifunctional diguanylate cyclase/phosphodiesterase [Sphingomonas mesophila]|uniref:putative bifunctional diguanylate cyclase/phosphodiesterase n=1 Tax=Sphingomonas mesophila TaxID=2303576 RepID=UPI000E5702C0|nr:EAL domain-containing protein [Sphingomonas mesophila]